MLVLTKDRGLGRRLQRLLEEVGQRQVIIINQSDQVLEYIKRDSCSAIFIDARLGETVWRELAQGLGQFSPGIRRIMILPEGAPPTGSLNHSGVDDYLLQPISSSDVYQALGSQTGKNHPVEKNVAPVKIDLLGNRRRNGNQKVSGGQADFSWLLDVEAARSALQAFPQAPGAVAIFLLQGKQLWAWNGTLDPAAAGELAQEAARSLRSPGAGQSNSLRLASSGLARYVRFSEAESFLLYTFRLDPQWLAAIAFVEPYSLRAARSEAGRLTQALLTTPPKLHGIPMASTQPDLPVEALKLWELPLAGEASDAQASPVAEPEAEDLSGELDSSDWLPLEALDEAELLSKAFTFEDMPPPTPTGIEASPIPTQENSWEWPELPDEEKDAPELEGKQTQFNPLDALEEEFAAATLQQLLPAEKGIAENILAGLQEVSGADQFIAQYRIEYACVLIPRLPDQQLTGTFHSWLLKTVRQLGVAFGWRLMQVEAHPDYLQWVASVPPQISASEVVQIMKRHLSERIFHQFPHLANENPSGEFWAPGYLVMTGGQLLPLPVIQRFLNQTRRRQGWTKDNH